jgi:hypothetical protein
MAAGAGKDRRRRAGGHQHALPFPRPPRKHLQRARLQRSMAT